VPYAVVEDIAASWERFAGMAAALTEPAPPGLILYAAGATDEGIRVISVWADAGAWQRFTAERLAPLVAALQEPLLPASVVRELEAEQLVVGAAPSSTGRERSTE
jgi:hypothetical protein